ncbi:hypothetical protein [Paenibacillus sinopodophylli]|uniref:hypothetical protein n=1 Tax=Paenibacillus sinopodophylli TaxID=1837342 RepID=UPI00110CD003|nr:hypothetical protein [Paenibacillus sinopodophylli]
MAKNTDKTVALLQLLRFMSSSDGENGLHVVVVKTSDPDPITLVMQGTKLALGLDIFEIPVDCYPLREGDQLLAFPVAGGEGGSNRWAILAKLNGGLVMATWDGSKVKPDGMAATYSATKPNGLTLANGDRVAIAPTWDGSQVSYIILNKY